MSRTDPQNETRAAEAGDTGFPPPEVIVTERKRVMCDGGGGALGHPRTYYDMGEETWVECGYCDRRFVLKGSKDDPEA